MASRPSLACGWRWLLSAFFLTSLLFEVVVHGTGADAPASAAPAPGLSPDEARVLQRIGAKLGVSHWNSAASLCNPASGVDCQCSYSSNQTICHVVRIVLKRHNFSGELLLEFADLPYLHHL
nr:unnamed protein product [Digitaria exilis]